MLQNVEHDHATGCMLWTGMTDKADRPLVYDGDRYRAGQNPLVYVQRWVFEHHAGPLLEGQTVTRACDKKACVNHEHATLWRNLRSSAFMANQVPTDTTRAQSCVHGHTYDEDNPPYVNPNKGTRSCRRCTRDSKLRSRGIDPTTVPYKPYRRGNTECRAGHGYDSFGFKDYGEGRICNECTRITSAKANLKKAYGLMFDDVARMLAEQGHACAACLEPFTEVNLDDFRMDDANVDHCHTGSHNRGLLCMGCNIALGKVKDNVKTLARMIEYLEAGAGRAADRWS
ncbi:endonuclease domain-containing protein [Streptomyces californicus]|uniref:endonuclease domain-containing protein n=1 Tax=Streptomyces californicus TaxID=67351 RepID=UPI0036B2B2CB